MAVKQDPFIFVKVKKQFAQEHKKYTINTSLKGLLFSSVLLMKNWPGNEAARQLTYTNNST